MVALVEALRAQASAQPDAIALTFEEETITFVALRAQVDGIAAHLRDHLGVSAGDRVAWMGLNHPHMVRLAFACATLGAIFTPLNSRLAPAEYRFLMEDAAPAVLFHDADFTEQAEAVADATGAVLPHTALDKLSADEQPVHAATDAPMLLVYTSGTTGRPKGVLLTREAVWANIENGQQVYAFAPGQVILITLPLFHVGGLCILLLPGLTHGATIDLHHRFDAPATLSALTENRLTTTILVPAQMAAIMVLPEWENALFPSLDYVVVGSSLIPLDQIRGFHAKGIPVSQVYGATETGPTAILLRLEDCMTHEGSAGTPAPLCTIEVRAPDGTVLGTDEPGDIWVSGPSILKSYWNRPEETAAVLVDGWYNTGDIGKRDADGFYWIVDRSKDVIISGGENIYPAEIERAALDHPGVAAIAIVGRPDPKWGETPVAIIEKKAGSNLTEGDFLAFLQGRIARYKQPKSVVFTASLPRNSMGKIEKQTLRQLVREGKI